MTVIKPLEKNLRVCIKCHATYVINGDPSGYWCEAPRKDLEIEGACQFCRQKKHND